MFNNEVLAINVNDNFVDVPSFDGLSSSYGTLDLVSTETTNVEKVIYDSYWAPWQPDVTELFEDKRYDLYKCSLFVDIPVEKIETFRIESGQTNSKHFYVSENYSITQRESITESVKIYGEFSKNHTDSIAATIESILTLGTSDTSGFKVTLEYENNNTIDINEVFNHSISVDYVETYTNNRDTYAYVTRCFRQKFTVLIGYIYQANYTRTRTGSGLFGNDNNYSYSLDDYTCVAINLYLLPCENAYYHVSYYIDDENGNRVFASQGNPSIIFV